MWIISTRQYRVIGYDHAEIREVIPMKLKVRRSTNAELRERQQSLRARLVDSLQAEDSSDEALSEMAWSGGFTYPQRELYDELRRVESLLGR